MSLNAYRPGKCFLLEIMQAGMFGRTRSAIKPFQGKRKKLALLSKPHILQSQMVLLSEHLVLDLDWMEFFRRSCALKKKWLIWGKQTSAASFQALWFVVLVGCCTWKYFFQLACLLPADNVSTVCDWAHLYGTHGTLKQFLKPRPRSEMKVVWVHLNKAVSQF